MQSGLHTTRRQTCTHVHKTRVHTHTHTHAHLLQSVRHCAHGSLLLLRFQSHQFLPKLADKQRARQDQRGEEHAGETNQRTHPGSKCAKKATVSVGGGASFQRGVTPSQPRPRAAACAVVRSRPCCCHLSAGSPVCWAARQHSPAPGRPSKCPDQAPRKPHTLSRDYPAPATVCGENRHLAKARTN